MVGENEKQQALYIHKLEIRKIVLDKLLVGALVIIVGFAANFAIERYRVQSTKERFLLEKRLEAIQLITNAYMSMQNNFDSSMNKSYISDGDKIKLRKDVDDFISVWTQNCVILSEHFTLQMDFVTWNYIALASLDLEIMKQYKEYFFDVYYKFYALTREELDLPEKSTLVSFEFLPWSVNKANDLGPQSYLEENFKQWQLTK